MLQVQEASKLDLKPGEDLVLFQEQRDEPHKRIGRARQLEGQQPAALSEEDMAQVRMPAPLIGITCHTSVV